MMITASIHYLHHYITGYTAKEISDMTKISQASLTALKNDIEKKGKNITVLTWTAFGQPVEEAIVEKAMQLKVDLIIIGKHSHHSIFPFLNTIVPGRLVSKANIPVLMTKPGSMDKEIKTVVIPIGKKFPAKKLELLEALRWKSPIQVRLVTFFSDDPDPSRQSLLNAFRLLKNQLFNAVDCEILHGRNKAKALLNYCNKIGADIMIVHSDKETKIDGWTGRHISDLLPASSRTQVLSV